MYFKIIQETDPNNHTVIFEICLMNKDINSEVPEAKIEETVTVKRNPNKGNRTYKEKREFEWPGLI